MKLLLILAILLSAASCSAQDSVPVVPVEPITPIETTVTVPVEVNVESTPMDVLYACAYKYDSKYNVSFIERNRVEYHPPSLPELLVYRITDTMGRRWSINEYDWKNYNCTKTTISKD